MSSSSQIIIVYIVMLSKMGEESGTALDKLPGAQVSTQVQ